MMSRPRLLLPLLALALLAGLALHVALGYRDAGPTPLRRVPDLGQPDAARQDDYLRAVLRTEAELRPAQAREDDDPRLLEAARMLEALRRLGNAQATYRLGWYYANGWGVERDRCAAALLFDEAARAGSAEAQFWLAIAYLPPNGRGVAPEKLRAFQWASAARAQGLPIALELFHFFTRDFSPAERAAAEASLRDWTPGSAPPTVVERFPYVPLLVGIWPRQTHHVMPCRQPRAPYETPDED